MGEQIDQECVILGCPEFWKLINDVNIAIFLEVLRINFATKFLCRYFGGFFPYIIKYY